MFARVLVICSLIIGLVGCAMRAPIYDYVRPVPQPGYVLVENNQYGTCGLLRNGDIRCWGNTQLELAGDFIGISGLCFLRRSGEIQCADPDFHPLPETERYRQISVNWEFACGITADWHLVCQDNSDRPGRTSLYVQRSTSTYSKVVTGWNNACALNTEGVVLCWGRDYGDGAGATQAINAPVAVVDLAMTGDARSDDTCLLSAMAAVHCLNSEDKQIITHVLPPSYRVSVGTYFKGYNVEDAQGVAICVITLAGEVKCEGDDIIDMQGPMGTPWVQVSVGGRHVCAVNRAGGVVCGGFNYHNRNNIPWYDPAQSSPGVKTEEPQ